MRNKAILALALSSLIEACTPAIQSDPVVVTYAPVPLPQAQSMTLNPVNWQVFNQQGLRNFAATMKPDQVLIGLDANNYDNLNLNLIEFRRYIEEQRKIVNAYRNIEELRAKALPSQSKTAK